MDGVTSGLSVRGRAGFIGRRLRETPVQLIGSLLVLGWAFPHVWHRQPGNDHLHLAKRPLARSLDEHPTEPGVDGHPRQEASRAGEPHPFVAATRLDRTQFLQHSKSVADLGGDRGLHERKTLDLTESGLGHLEDDGGQVGAQDLRFGELGTGGEVLLTVEPDRDPRAEPAAAARPLIGAGLRYRFNRQPLHLGARRITGDARHTGVDHEPDTGDRD